MTQNTQNKSWKWFTISGRSKHQARKHTHTRVQWSHASEGLAQACPNGREGVPSETSNALHFCMASYRTERSMNSRDHRCVQVQRSRSRFSELGQLQLLSTALHSNGWHSNCRH